MLQRKKQRAMYVLQQTANVYIAVWSTITNLLPVEKRCLNGTIHKDVFTLIYKPFNKYV